MIAPAFRPVGSEMAAIEPLAPADVPAMQALVELTRPGPFGTRTIEMGRYLGIKQDGRLVAMAGERMHLPGFTEISAVCTAEQARGRGLAAALTAHVADAVWARGEQPFLHVAGHNITAKRVYERIGFTVRRTTDFVVLRPPG